MESLKYLGLIGKIVRMERPANLDELSIPGHPPTTGLQGYITTVSDCADGYGVFIGTDEGLGFNVYPGEKWKFHVESLPFYNYTQRIAKQPEHKLEWTAWD